VSYLLLDDVTEDTIDKALRGRTWVRSWLSETVDAWLEHDELERALVILKFRGTAPSPFAPLEPEALVTCLSLRLGDGVYPRKRFYHFLKQGTFINPAED